MSRDEITKSVTALRQAGEPGTLESPLTMIVVSSVYATDEDIALRASADFSIICPKDQKLASGNDGAFPSGNPWTLTSASVDFQARGLQPGNIVQLTQPISAYKPPGEAFVVVSVAPNAATLRRKGQLAGVGQPPAAADGLSQVEFLVTTFGPQLVTASYDLNRRYGIEDLIAGRRSCDLFDPNEVCEAAVLTVLYRQYLDMSRGADERSDIFAAKSQSCKQELDDLLARTVVHWAVSSGILDASEPTTRFSTRISR
jgi:hypothetical protein